MLVLTAWPWAAEGQPAPMQLGAERLAVPIIDAEQLRALRTRLHAASTDADDPEAWDTIVLCPARFRAALTAWMDYRTLQGHKIKVLDGLQPARELQAQIRELAAKHPIRYVVIVGDAEPDMATDPTVRTRSVPTFYGEARVNPKYGSEPLIATDNPYGDLDDDHTPELSVGRICCDTSEDLFAYVHKVIQYETSLSPGLWRRRINLVAGMGGFGPLADAAIETAAKKFLTEMIPPEYVTTMTYGSWRSPFCPDPRCFRDTWLNQVHAGGLFLVYMGHASPNRLSRLAIGDAVVPVLEPDDVPSCQSDVGPPIAVLLACYTGAFDQASDCVAEEMLMTPKGPVAVICGSRVTMPYGMAVFGTALMDAYFHESSPLLGDVFLAAKRELASDGPENSSNRKLLDAIALTLSPNKDELPLERQEHVLMFQLLGDPLLVTAKPALVQVDCRRHTEAGKIIQVHGESPIGGKCLVELACRRDRLTSDVPRRTQLHLDHSALAAMNDAYALANDQRWTGRRVDIQPGAFVVELNVPSHATGAGHVRVFVEGEDRFALGAAPIFIQAPQVDDALRTINARR